MEICGSIRLIVYIFIFRTPIFITAVHITLVLHNVMISCSDQYKLLSNQNCLLCFSTAMSVIYYIQSCFAAYMAYANK
jgi:hypothetical protein